MVVVNFMSFWSCLNISLESCFAYYKADSLISIFSLVLSSESHLFYPVAFLVSFSSKYQRHLKPRVWLNDWPHKQFRLKCQNLDMNLDPRGRHPSPGWSQSRSTDLPCSLWLPVPWSRQNGARTVLYQHLIELFLCHLKLFNGFPDTFRIKKKALNIACNNLHVPVSV